MDIFLTTLIGLSCGMYTGMSLAEGKPVHFFIGLLGCVANIIRPLIT